MTRYLLPRQMRTSPLVFVCVGGESRITHYTDARSASQALGIDPRDTGNWNIADRGTSDLLNNLERYIEISRDNLDILDRVDFRRIPYNKDILDFQFVRELALRLPKPPTTNHKLGVPKGRLP